MCMLDFSNEASRVSYIICSTYQVCISCELDLFVNAQVGKLRGALVPRLVHEPC